MTKPCTIGLDLGGTNIKFGLLDADNRLVYRASLPTEADGGYAHVLGRLAIAVEQIVQESGVPRAEIIGIGLGSPGPMSPETGIVHGAPNLPGWVDVPVRDDLRQSTGMPVALDNDANLYALAEYSVGAGRGCRHLVMLTLGTGIGGGVILNGALHRGHFGNAGEIGHMIVVEDGRPCGCGQRGCLERYASAVSIAERVAEAIHAGRNSALVPFVTQARPISSRDVADAAAAGDGLAQQVWDEACRHLAIACVNIQHLLNVECILLGGGLIGAGAQLLEPVRRHLRERTWRVAKDAPRIELATLGDDAGIIGAAAAARTG